MKKYLAIILLIFTTSCVETILAGAATTGVIMTQDKSAGDTKNDVIIEAKIDKEFIASGLKNPANKIGVTVDNQRVLLTGIIDNANLAKKANEIAWKVNGVKEVIDEIQIIDNKALGKNFINYFQDASITTQINSKALINKNISSVNFDVITINKIVYLIGTAQNQSELKAINDLAAKTSGVKKVISHIVLKQ